jgi:serine/threonine protein kinase
MDALQSGEILGPKTTPGTTPIKTRVRHITQMNDTTSSRTLATGDYVAWYRIERVLGQGGFGVTYLATDTNLDHLVALKEYLPANLVRRDSDKTIAPITDRTEAEYREGLDSFLREARTLVKFRHPNIVRVMSVFEAHSSAYLVMEYERGVEFRDYVKQRRNIAETELIDLFLSIADGLDQVHQTGYLHRDIKPVNLIIRDNGTPVLLDFGSSRRVDVDVKNTSFVSAGYTALEQYRAGSGLKVGPWTDIYALGGTLYFAITGESPVSPVSRLAAHIKGAPDPLRPASEVGAGRYSPTFLQAVDQALAFHIDNRPASLAEWCESLRQARDEGASGIALPAASVPATAAAEPAEVPDSIGSVPGPAVSAAQASTYRSGAAPVARSRLLKQPRAAKPATHGRLWLVLSMVAVLLAATVFGSRFMQQQRQLNSELSQAEAELGSQDLPVFAVGVFRRLLDTHPQNERAKSGFDAGVAKIQRRISKQIESGQLVIAAANLRALQGLAVASPELVRQLRTAELDQQIEADIREIEAHNAQGRFDAALGQITAVREVRDDERLQALEQSARAGLARNAAQQREAEAQAERERQQTRARIAEANKRQRIRRERYTSYLSSVESALDRGDHKSARRWLDSARALQLDDQALSGLERRVALAEDFASEPFTEYEIRYAKGRFNAFKEAVESKNAARIAQLSVDQPAKRSVLENLFSRYRQVTASVIDVQTSLEPKRVTATLRIETLAKANGDIVYPASSYRDFPLTLRRERYLWSNIEW